MSLRCSGFRSGKRVGQSIVSMPSTSKNRYHTLATWDRALSCTRRNPGPTEPAYGLTIGLRISSLYLLSVKLPWLSICRPVPHSKEMPPQTITEPPPNLSCWTMLHAWWRSPVLLQALTRPSDPLKLNRLPFVKSTGRQWRTCQFWCFLANDDRVWGLSQQMDVETLNHGCRVGFWQFGQQSVPQCHAASHYVGNGQCFISIA